MKIRLKTFEEMKQLYKKEIDGWMSFTCKSGTGKCPYQTYKSDWLGKIYDATFDAKLNTYLVGEEYGYDSTSCFHIEVCHCVPLEFKIELPEDLFE